MSILQISKSHKQVRSKLERCEPSRARILGSLYLTLVMLAVLAGCTAAPSVLTVLPVTGSSQFQVHEYAIIEQSRDNPTGPEFQQRVQTAVSAMQSGWHFPGPSDSIQGPNEDLAPFDYHLKVNPTPPFSAYALYHGSQLVQRDIARFWPVSLKDSASGSDFLLAFETMGGEKLVASADGVHPWPVQANQAAGIPDNSTPPVYYGDQIAYAETVGSEVSVHAGSGILYSGTTPALSAGSTTQHSLVTWGTHWALEVNGQVIRDGKNINQTQGYDKVFDWQVIASQPFYFYTRSGITHMNFAGRDLPYLYDQVVHSSTGPTAIYNPGSNGHIVWFYALRDGLWYYVEAGLFQ